ncbi:piggyBac transposable element-derived protein 4-like [Belonocnema kinseyi]|uniref:piggyBac transposable element-derived protein 4-like n=1 Tax=Belonocnema kinseyi TaxID=2817044 RepID=UPI00143DEB8B|nr:piggyBac transposable element-derived protein 4-like [Belonocnema kinseyi]
MRNIYGLTVVGTIRKNKQEITPSFTRAAAAGTTRFAHANGNTLVSHCPKRNNVVLLLPSLHKNRRIDENTRKPEIIDLYDHTKGETDTFDQMIHAYTTARATLRWPLRLFYGMLNQAGINSLML